MSQITVGLAQTQEMITGRRLSIASGVQMTIPPHIFYRGQSLRLSSNIRPRAGTSQGPNPGRTIGFSAPNNGPRLDLTLTIGEDLVKAVCSCPLVPCTRWKEGTTYFLALSALTGLYQVSHALAREAVSQQFVHTFHILNHLSGNL